MNQNKIKLWAMHWKQTGNWTAQTTEWMNERLNNRQTVMSWTETSAWEIFSIIGPLLDKTKQTTETASTPPNVRTAKQTNRNDSSSWTEWMIEQPRVWPNKQTDNRVVPLRTSTKTAGGTARMRTAAWRSCHQSICWLRLPTAWHCQTKILSS